MHASLFGMESLQERLGYYFSDLDLLRLSLTHPSYAQQNNTFSFNNQRLEFLGDAVLSLVLAEKVYSLFPDQREGSLAEALVCQKRQPLSVHLKIDTGMGRIGVWHTETAALYQRIQRSPYVHLEGIFTHFSSMAVDPDYTRLQLENFHKALATLPGWDAKPLLIHTNSIDIETFDAASCFNAVRVGLLQFGVAPHPHPVSGRRTNPVLSLHSRVGLVKTLPAGTSISYNHTHTLKRPSHIAVLTAGYSDGIPTHLSNKGHVLIQGHRCPIIGRVTMDQTLVDVTDLAALDHMEITGEHATFIGAQGGDRITATEFSAWADEIPWEVLCVISRKVPRIYHPSNTTNVVFDEPTHFIVPESRLNREQVLGSAPAAR